MAEPFPPGCNGSLPQVDSVLHSLKKARCSSGLSIRQLLGQAASKRKSKNHSGESRAENARPAAVQTPDDPEALAKAYAKQRMLKRLLAANKSCSVSRVEENKAPLRSALLSRIARRVKSLQDATDDGNKSLPQKRPREQGTILFQQTQEPPLKTRTVEEHSNSSKELAKEELVDMDVAFSATKTPERSDQSMNALLGAIADLSDEDKAAYLQAVATSPAVVQAESDPAWFLGAVQFDAGTAARRLCDYWQQRKDTFGDRAFRPVLDLSGQGALNEEDIGALRSNLFVRLPPDNNGREVIYADLTSFEKRKAYSNVGWRLRFYMMAQCSASNPSTHTEGIVELRDQGNLQFSMNHIKLDLENIASTFPGMHHHFHVCYLPPRKDRHMFLKMGLPVLKRMMQPAQSWSSTHVASSLVDLLGKLQKHGMSSNKLPTSLGGSWCVEDHQTFQETARPSKVPTLGATGDAMMASRKVAAAEGLDDSASRKRQKMGGDQASESAHFPVDSAIDASDCQSQRVASVLHSVRKAKESTGLSVQELLAKAVARRSALQRSRPMLAAAQPATVAAPVAEMDLKTLLEREATKKRLLQKLLAQRKTTNLAKPTSAPSPVRALLLSRIAGRLQSLSSKVTPR